MLFRQTRPSGNYFSLSIRATTAINLNYRQNKYRLDIEQTKAGHFFQLHEYYANIQL
jgi:hypothetical protein